MVNKPEVPYHEIQNVFPSIPNPTINVTSDKSPLLRLRGVKKKAFPNRGIDGRECYTEKISAAWFVASVISSMQSSQCALVAAPGWIEGGEIDDIDNGLRPAFKGEVHGRSRLFESPGAEEADRALNLSQAAPTSTSPHPKTSSRSPRR